MGGLSVFKQAAGAIIFGMSILTFSMQDAFLSLHLSNLTATLLEPGKALDTWEHRKEITVDSTYVDANLSDFPLLVKINNDVEMGVSVWSSTGFDIRFGDENDNLLAYERESWTVASGSGSGEFWVNVPFISSSTGAKLYVYYGKDGATDTQDAASVWDSNYKAVYHLNESAGDGLDSTSNNNDIAWFGDLPDARDSKVGDGQHFDGTGDYGKVASADFDVSGTNPLTMSAWFRTAEDPGNIAVMVTETGQGSSTYDKGIGIKGTTQVGHFYYYSGGIISVDGSTDIIDDTWHQVTGVFLGAGGSKVYVDGTQEGTNPAASTYNFTTPELVLSFSKTPYAYYSDYMDEIRFSDIARDAEWIKFEHANMAESDNEIALAAEDNRIRGSDWSGYKRIIIDSANVDSTLTDFSLYVKVDQDSDLSGVQADGSDIRFTTSTGVILPYERESWTIASGSGSGDFWVKVPSISSSTGTVIYMYYGNADALDGEDALDVWTEDQTAVWLFGDGAGSSTAADSTGNGYTGTLTNMNTTTAWTSESNGKALDFGGLSSGDFLQLDSSIAYADVDWSYSLLVNTDSLLNFSYWFGNGNAEGAYTRALLNTTGLLDVYQDGNTRERFSTGSNKTGLHCYNIVYDAANNLLKLYRDGAWLQSLSATGTWTINKLFNIGTGGATNNSIDGRAINVALYSDQRSASEIKFTSANFLEADNELTWDTASERVTTMPASTDLVLATDSQVSVEDVPQRGIETVQLEHNDEKLAEFDFDFEAGDLDLSSITVEQDSANAKAVVHGLPSETGVVDGTYTMFIKKDAAHARVRICSGKTTKGCTSSDEWSFLASDTGAIVSTNNGFDTTGITVTVEDGFWKIAGLTE